MNGQIQRHSLDYEYNIIMEKNWFSPRDRSTMIAEGFSYFVYFNKINGKKFHQYTEFTEIPKECKWLWNKLIWLPKISASWIHVRKTGSMKCANPHCVNQN